MRYAQVRQYADVIAGFFMVFAQQSFFETLARLQSASWKSKERSHRYDK